MAKKRKSGRSNQPLQGEALIKETNRRIRSAKGLWDAHRNAACRHEREQALALYNQLTPAQKEKVPQQLRIWLRYRSEKYFGTHQTQPGDNQRSGKRNSQNKHQTPTRSPGSFNTIYEAAKESVRKDDKQP